MVAWHTHAQVQALWKLMKQEIVVAGHEPVSRPTWRSRANWRQIKRVTVLTLRHGKRASQDHDSNSVEWSHSWLVRGHWRNQPYKNSDGSVRHEQIWIAPYVKGPEDKPLVLKDRAVELIR